MVSNEPLRASFLIPDSIWRLRIFFFLALLKSLLSIEATRQQGPTFAVSLLVITLAALFLIEFTEKRGIFGVTKDQLHASLPNTNGQKTLPEYVKEPKELTHKGRKKYTSSLEDTLDGGTWGVFPTLTWPQIAYVVSVSYQYLFFITVFWAFGWSLRLFLKGNTQFLEHQERIVKNLFRTYVFVVLWVPWRSAFEGYRGELYSAANLNPIKVLAVAFIPGGIYLAIIAWNRYEQRITSVIGLVASLSVGTLIFNKQWLLHAFPKAPSWRHFVMLFLLTLLVLVPFIASITLVREAHHS